jgi:outer membrane receptor protein involved in Fe transport
MKPTLLSSAVAATMVMGLSLPIAAQDTSSADDLLEEITVTARKKGENLQDVPLSINAMSEAMLEDAGIVNMGDIADFTPGFDFAQSFGRQDFRPAIRGQSTIQGGANAGLFVDGIYIGEGGPTFPTAALERVEVVKGPQSTLYGRATLAGAINYVLKKPGEEFAGEVSATAGEYGELRSDITLSGPLSDTMGYMVSASYYSYDGQYTNDFGGNDIGAPARSDDIGGEETTSLVGVLTFAPSETFDGSFTLMWEKSEDDPYAIALQDSDNNNCGFGPAPAPPAGTPGDGTTRSGYNNSGYYCGEVDTDDILDANGGKTSLETGFYDNMGTEFEALRTSLTLNWDLGDHTLTSRTGYADYEDEARQDQGFGGQDYYVVGVPFPPFAFPGRFGFLTETLADYEEFSQELTLSFDTEGRFNYMVGASYYTHEESGRSRNSSRAGLVATDPGRDVYPLIDVAKKEVENFSVYGSITYEFSEDLILDAELRHSEEEVKAYGGLSELNLSETYMNLLPRLSLSWHATEDVMIYSTVSKGNKPGDVNTANNLTDVQREVEESNAWNYELGFKSTLMEGRATLNAAVYYIDWEEQQLTTTTSGADGTGALSILANLGQTEIQGLEMDFTWKPTDNWNLYLGYAYTDSEVKEFLLDAEEHLSANGMLSGYEEAAQLGFPYAPNGDVIISGTHTPQVSKHQATFSNTFHGELSDDWEWFLRADYVYRSKRYAQVYNEAHTGDSSKINLRAGINSDDLDIELWVNNLTDDDTAPALIRYVETESGFFTFGPDRTVAATLPEKRAAGVSVTYRF